MVSLRRPMGGINLRPLESEIANVARPLMRSIREKVAAAHRRLSPARAANCRCPRARARTPRVASEARLRNCGRISLSNPRETVERESGEFVSQQNG